MSTNVLDRFYDSMQNVVLRDDNGYPSVFVKHNKVNSSYFDSSLPEHTHPAFVYSDGEDDAILIGKYDGSSLTENGTIYSLPNMVPNYKGTYAGQSGRIRMHNKQTGLTIADFGYLMLSFHKYCKENGVRRPCDGNNANNGGDGVLSQPWKKELEVNVGDVYCYAGWNYVCKTAHTTSLDLLPPDQPLYWERAAKVGGTCVVEDWRPYNDDTVEGDGAFFYNVNTNGLYHGRTLTGSGPVSWYNQHDITQEADIMGNVCNWIYGVRLYNGELQIYDKNDAGDPDVDYITGSGTNPGGHWRAILPSGSDSTYTLVTPGTSGTIKMTYSGGKILWAARELESSELSNTIRTVDFKSSVTYDTSTMAVPPSILYELGLLPLSDQIITYNFFVRLGSGQFTMLWMKPWNTGGNSIGQLRFNMYDAVGGSKGLYGSRPRARYKSAT